MKVCEEQSINKAAGKLFITQQGLSRVIANLEKNLNVKLLERNARGVFPTEEGQYLYEKCEKLICMLDEIEAGMKQMANRRKRLTIGYACGVMHAFSFQLIQKYKSEHREMEITCEEFLNQELIDKITQSEIDVGFIIGKNSSGELVKEQLTERQMVILVYPGHPFYEKDGIYIRELENEPLIMLGERSFLYYEFQRMCRQCGFEPQIVVKTMESAMTRKLCREHVGIGLDVDFELEETALEGRPHGELHALARRRINVGHIAQQAVNVSAVDLDARSANLECGASQRQCHLAQRNERRDGIGARGLRLKAHKHIGAHALPHIENEVVALPSCASPHGIGAGAGFASACGHILDGILRQRKLNLGILAVLELVMNAQLGLHANDRGRISDNRARRQPALDTIRLHVKRGNPR